MEKVKVTQEQADAIESLIADHGHKYDRFIREIADDRNWFTGSHEPIRKMEIEVFARALYRGYEAEPEFKVDDWVKSKHGKGIGIIKRISRMGYHTDFGLIADHDDIRHATLEEIAKEKERKWWAKHGRNVWELKIDDILVKKDTHDLLRVRNVGCKEYGVVGLDNRNKVYGQIYWEEIMQRFKVVCFAEDRKDV